MELEKKKQLYDMFIARKNERLNSFNNANVNATCVSGVSIRYNDPVRVILLIENLIIQDTLAMEDRNKHFKVFGLPMQGIYKGNGTVELKSTPEHLFNHSLFSDIAKNEINLTEFINSLKDQSRGFTPYQQKCHFSVALIDEKVFQSTKNFSGMLSIMGVSYKEREDFFNDVFYKLSNIKVEYTPKDEDKDNKEKNEFMLQMRTETMRRILIEQECKKVDSYFYDYQNLILKTVGKNQYNLINAFHAIDVLNVNSLTLSPMKLINGSKLSCLKNIQQANLEELDYELKERINYKVEQIPCITFSDIREADKKILFSSDGKKNMDMSELQFKEKSKIFKGSDLFPLNSYIDDDSIYIKIINNEDK